MTIAESGLCRITLLPSELQLEAPAGELLADVLAEIPEAASTRVRLEKGALSPAEQPEAEEEAFTSAERTEGWVLTTQRRLTGDINLMLDIDAEKEKERPDTALSRGCGLAFDLGGATIGAALVELGSGLIWQLSACRNSQLDEPKEIRDHINQAATHPEHGPRLTAQLRKDMNELTERLLQRAKCSAVSVGSVVIVGSHTQICLLRGVAPGEDDRFGSTLTLRADEVGLSALSITTPVYLPPSVSRSIGSGAVSAALAAGLWTKKDDPELTLLADLGMGGEVMLAGDGRIITCAIPNLPMEGAGLTFGMPPSPGAIIGVELEPEFSLRTVKDTPPKGLTGAGLLSAVWAMLKLDMIDDEGRIRMPKELPAEIAERVHMGAGGIELHLAETETGIIALTQEDVLQMQITKSCVRSACEALLAKMSADTAQIKEALLAGSYNSELDAEKAWGIGMLPDVGSSSTHSQGDAALQGAYLILEGRHMLAEAEKLAACMEELNLNSDRIYAEAFLNHMAF